MKLRNILFTISSLFAITGCVAVEHNALNSNQSFESNDVVSSIVSTTSRNTTSSNNITTTSNAPSKTTVAAHTLKDTSVPIDPNSYGEQVDEDTWDSFRNADKSKFKDNYNYTYIAYSGGVSTSEYFTKNGYFINTSAGKIYYERKSASNFYQYISTNDGWLREETTLDIQDKYTSRIVQEIYVHMFDYDNYEFDDYDGTYRYLTTAFGCAVKFQGGYLTELYYSMGSIFFHINASFSTAINIPASYHYN